MSYLRGSYHAYIGTMSRETTGRLSMELIGPGDRTFSMPLPTFDALVMMRHAEMSPAQRKAATARALRLGAGNVGAEALRRETAPD